MNSRVRFGAALLLGTLLAPATASGQQRGPLASGPLPVTTAPIVTRAAARGYSVVAVAVPAQIRSDMAVSYEVESRSDVPVLGRRAGSMSAFERKPVLITVGVPATAPAGRLLAASVVFRTSDGAATIVPVELDVAPEYTVEVSVPERIPGIAGARLELPVRILNSGNAVDTLQLELGLPEGWRPQGDGAAPIVLLPGLSVERVLAITVDRGIQSGDFFVRLRALRRGQAVAERVTVVPVGQRAVRSSDGPVLTSALASVAGGATAAFHVLQLEARGPLTGDVRVDARAALESGVLDGFTARGLSGVGSYVYSPEVSLWAPRWRATAGNIEGSFSTLAGQNAGGRGAAFRYSGERTGWSLAAGRPMQYPGTESGYVYGGTWRQLIQGVSVQAAASRISAARSAPATLDAASVGLASAVPIVGKVSGELGYRAYEGGSGIGWAASADRALPAGQVSVRFAHAPGGSTAFARALDELAIDARHALGKRVMVGGGMYRSSDANPSFGSLESSSWNLYQNLTLSGRMSLGTQLLRTEFNATSGDLDMGQDATTLNLSLQSAGSTLFYSGGAFLGRSSRSLSILADGSRDDAERAGGNATIGWAGSRGIAQLETSYERSSAGGGYLPEILTVGVSLNRLDVMALGTVFTFSGGASHRRFGATRDPLTTLRAALSVPMRGDFRVTAAYERDPLFTAGAGGRPWTVALKLERAVVLPRIAVGGTRGYVYRDVNGNGVRDEGEAGLPDVTVRLGGIPAVTDESGRYYFWKRSSEAVEIDPLTLPFGWFTVGEGSRGTRDLAVVPAGAVELNFTIVADGNGRKPEVDLTPVNVTVVDAAGRGWLARRTTANRAVFDALPVGEYRLELDFDAAAEPLRPREGELTLTVRQGVTQREIALVGRPLRFGTRTPGKDS